jgi:NAD(P)-dependent dehydrogenase (short-subunit alcohol dehydrogenase family)
MIVSDVSDCSIAELCSLTGRRAVITGGARGLGEALGDGGASLVLGDLDGALADIRAAELHEKYGVAAHGVEVEVADSASVLALADQAEVLLGGIDIWVNNAGVRGCFVGSQTAATRMQGHGGVIVNIASTGCVKAAPGVAHYITSKHAVVGITKALSTELGPMGIRVLAIAPSMTQTEGRVDFLDRYTTPEIRTLITEMEGRVPLGRIGVPDDVARVALFAASDLSMLMTGSVLFVDSGESAL